AFHQKANLMCHVLTHLKNRTYTHPFECVLCERMGFERKFTRKSSLRRHVLTKHPSCGKDAAWITTQKKPRLSRQLCDSLNARYRVRNEEARRCVQNNTVNSPSLNNCSMTSNTNTVGAIGANDVHVNSMPSSQLVQIFPEMFLLQNPQLLDQFRSCNDSPETIKLMAVNHCGNSESISTVFQHMPPFTLRPDVVKTERQTEKYKMKLFWIIVMCYDVAHFNKTIIYFFVLCFLYYSRFISLSQIYYSDTGFVRLSLFDFKLINNNDVLVIAIKKKMTSDKSQFPNPKDALFSVGLIADPQHADVDDRWNFLKTTRRRYRLGLEITKNAVKTWNDENESNPRPSMIICLGDIIDGLNKNINESTKVKLFFFLILKKQLQMYMNTTRKLKPKILTSFCNCKKKKKKAFGEFEPNTDKKAQISVQDDMAMKGSNRERIEKYESSKTWKMPKYPYFHNLIGNHEMYNFNRMELMDYMYNPTSHPLEYYYSLSPYPGFVFIFLDSYVLSMSGYNYITKDGDKSKDKNGVEEQDDHYDANDAKYIEESKAMYALSNQLLNDNNINKDKSAIDGLDGDLKRCMFFWKSNKQ
ncbi:manganese-dependent ADP-ribose/CDP-alcohol diphosphatase-like protein, partial [Reticulomyxa filosa]